MMREHDVEEKISKKEFLLMIKNFSEEDIEVTDHALFRLNEKQRKIYEEGVLKDRVMNGVPIEICKQNNGNLAVLYYYEKDRVLKILLKIRSDKVYIVTFYILNREQKEKIGK